MKTGPDYSFRIVGAKVISVTKTKVCKPFIGCITVSSGNNKFGNVKLWVESEEVWDTYIKRCYKSMSVSKGNKASFRGHIRFVTDDYDNGKPKMLWIVDYATKYNETTN